MLEIKNLYVRIKDKEIIKGVDLTIKAGELHALMGRNGSGKSTLAHVITGKDGYEIEGDILFNGESILDKTPEERALDGIFMSFQYPVVIPGVNNMYFLKAALNARRKNKGEAELDAMDFLTLIKAKIKQVEMDESYLSRAVNDGFSGGEKKRNEILQLLTLEPIFAILDETDSGLDIDALKVVADGVNRLRSEAQLRAIAEQAGIDASKELICHCQSHRRSALVYIALKSLGFKHLKAYPGSWAEWGNNLDTPIE